MLWYRGFGRIMRAKGIVGIRFHDLRHASACLDFAAGVSIKEVSEKLGYSSIAVTSAIYVNVLESSKVAAAAKLDDHVGNVFRRRVTKA